MHTGLKEQTAIVTGATNGIGKAIAIKLAEEGVRVAVLGTNRERGVKVVEEIEQRTEKERATFFAVDVSQTAAVEATIAQILEQFGHIDILVNNAGVTQDQLLMKMSEEEWDRVMDTNAKSCYNMTRPLVRHMLKARKGKIINVSSVVALSGNPGQVNYAASKAAVIGFTKALAQELASRQICVNCVAPGYIETAMTEQLSEEQKRALLSKIPIGKMGQPDDIANMVLFLASSLSNYITGQVFTVDGGMVMR